MAEHTAESAGVVEIVERMLGEQRMGGFTPSYLADRYAERFGVGRERAIEVLTACHKSGALVAFEVDGFPMITTPDRLPPRVTTTTTRTIEGDDRQ